MKRTVMFLGIVFVASLVPPTNAGVTTAVGNGADTYITSSYYNNAANQNYGSAEVVAIKHDLVMPGNNRKGYLRFDLSSLLSPIIDASLQLCYAGKGSDPSASPSTYNVYGLNDGHAGESWDESTITWNNAPGNYTASAGGLVIAETTFLGSFDLNVYAISVGDLVSFSSPAFLSFLQGDTNNLVTLILTRQQRNTNNEYFASKESTTLSAPVLNINSAVIPAPGAILLGAIGVGLVGWLRRRKTL